MSDLVPATHQPRDEPAGRGVTRRSFLAGLGGTVAATAAAGTAGSLLAACSSSKGSGGKAKQMTFWNFYGPADKANPQSDWFVKLASDWNATNDVKVKLRYLPVSQYLDGTTLQTAFSSGSGPDIFLISPGDFLRYYNGHVLEELTPHLTDQAKADFVPKVLDTRIVDDKIYGLPMEIEPLAIYYSVKAFESVGLSEADIPQTWDQLLEVAHKLTNSKRFGVLFETIPGYYQNFTWYPFMWMGGGNAVENNKSAFNSAATVQALKLWQDTIKEGVAPKKPRGDGAGNVLANLVSGYCGMQQTGIWSVADFAQQAKGFQYGLFKLPTPPGGSYTTDMGGWAFVANAKGKNPEAAAKFIAWALGSTSPEGIERQRQWNTVAKTNLPPRKSVQQAAQQHGAFASGAMATFLNEIAPAGRGEPRYPPPVYQAISDAVQACQLNGTDPAKAASDASGKIDAYLGGYQGAPIL